MAEGKLTLPVIYALNNHHMDSMITLARKVKQGGVNPDEIAVLVEFAKQSGGIDYAEKRMQDYHSLCQAYIDENVKDNEIHKALTAYIDFVIQRNL
jgi:octaprenyl-diphosphate synthase